MTFDLLLGIILTALAYIGLLAAVAHGKIVTDRLTRKDTERPKRTEAEEVDHG